MLLADDTAWDNEWQDIPGPEAVLISAVQNPELMPCRASAVRDRRGREADPIDTIFELLIQDEAFTGSRSSPCPSPTLH